MTITVIWDWSVWKSVPLLALCLAPMLLPGWPCLGVGLGWMERLHTDVGALAPEMSPTCPVGIGIREDPYVMWL